MGVLKIWENPNGILVGTSLKWLQTCIEYRLQQLRSMIWQIRTSFRPQAVKLLHFGLLTISQ